MGHYTRKNRFKSYVFIDTVFKRDNQTFFMLTACEKMRNIQLDCDIQMRSMHEQVVHIQSIVKQHYIDCNCFHVYGLTHQF